jgi:hypothetical protein
MINHEEVAICRRRHHVVELSLDTSWKQCRACGMWVREVITIEERTTTPRVEDQDRLVFLQRKSGQLKSVEFDPEEAAICKRRGHDLYGLEKTSWVPCRACGTWLREKRTIEEQESQPVDDLA